MLAAAERSGLDETSHEGAVAIVGIDGELIAHSGLVDRPFYLRSAAKPFQAHVAQQSGAGLSPLQLAIAAASHHGMPVHVSHVSRMLAEVGLTENSLKCPRSWPTATSAHHDLVAQGHRQPRRIWHNCSGKHASWLRACVANGWPIDSYLSPSHPLQGGIIRFVSELGGYDVEPVGVDGCGAPVLRTSTRVMARLFSRLATTPELRPIFDAMHTYPALLSGNTDRNGDSVLTAALHSAAKGGAAGCLGVALADGRGIAVKSWDGSYAVAQVAAVAAIDQLVTLTPAQRSTVQQVGFQPVHGGGEIVGHLEPRLELSFT